MTLNKVWQKLLIRCFRARRLKHEISPEHFALSATKVSISIAANDHLFAWWIPATLHSENHSAPTVIVLHGWGSNAGQMLSIAPWINNLGLHALFLDARCHGASSDADFTSMPRFAEDLESARNWVLSQAQVDHRNVIAIGHSVGAGAVLLSATRTEWAGVVSLSAFAHPQEMMKRYVKDLWLPSQKLLPWIVNEVQSIIGAKFDDIAPINTIQNCRCPVMLVHGEDDMEVPVTDAQRIMQAAPPDVQTFIVPNVGHDLRPAMNILGPHVCAFIQRIVNSQMTIKESAPLNTKQCN